MITPPNLPNGNPIKERLMLFGPPGVGKTHVFWTIARWHQELGSDAMFYGINTDNSYEALWTNPEFQGLENVAWEQVGNYQEYIDAARKFTRQMRSQDWISLDLADHAWHGAQDEYARAKSKGNLDDMGDMWLEGGPGDYPIGGWEWGMPNARLRALTNNQLIRAPGHLLVVAGQKELLTESSSGKTKEDPKIGMVFKHAGYKPVNIKPEDLYRYHTIIHVDASDVDFNTGRPVTEFLTAKERWGNRKRLGRPMSNGRRWKGEVVEDFFMDYLVNIAGWEM